MSELTFKKIGAPAGFNLELAAGTKLDLSSGNGAIMPAGSVVQIDTQVTTTSISTPTGGIWHIVHTFSLDNVTAGNAIILECSPSMLMEHAGTVLCSIFNSAGVELGRTVQHSAGNGSWRTPNGVIFAQDTNPVSGTNTYTLRMYSSGTHVYFNYNYSSFPGNTHIKLTEVKQ